MRFTDAILGDRFSSPKPPPRKVRTDARPFTCHRHEVGKPGCGGSPLTLTATSYADANAQLLKHLGGSPWMAESAGRAAFNPNDPTTIWTIVAIEDKR